MTEIQVLVVDDQRAEAQSFADLIAAKTGLECLATDDPQRAIAVAESQTLTVLVLDQNMPRMSGTSLYARLSKLVPSAAALMLTQEDDAQAAGAAMRLGYKERIHKANIDALPGVVLRLHIDVTAERARNAEPIRALHRGRWDFRRRPDVDLISCEMLDERFVDDADWREIVEVNAGQEKKISGQQTLNNSVSFEDASTEKIASELGIKVRFLTSKVSSSLTDSIKRTNSAAVTSVTSLEDSYRLPDEPADPGQIHVRARRIEYAPEFRRYQVVLRSTCMHCRNPRFFGGVVRVPGDVVSVRHVDYMSDGTEKQVPTGRRRLA